MHNFLLNLENAFRGAGLLGLGASFIAGLLVSLSPCIYPLIPITVGIVGAASERSHLKGFIISLVFVLGVCATYTILGITAALLGTYMGTLVINPITYFILAVLFLFLGLVMLGVLKVYFSFFSPSMCSRKGYLALFGLGMISAFGLIPCNFPVLGSVLTLIALRQDILYGAVALFLFSFGYGAPLLILGTFTTLLRKLPKQGLWLIALNKILGVILIMVGVYFLINGIRMLQ
jgi:thiol:disulfide interchange protein DsbD